MARKNKEVGFFNIPTDQSDKKLEKDISIKDSNSTDKMQNESVQHKKDYNVSGFMRICINVSDENLLYLKAYKKKYGISVATKCSDILNSELEKMRKESK